MFFDHVGRDSWCIVWAAGAGTVGSDERSLEEETSVVQNFAATVADTLSDPSYQTGPGLCVLISSAGGVYAGRLIHPIQPTARRLRSVPTGLQNWLRASLGQDAVTGMSDIDDSTQQRVRRRPATRQATGTTSQLAYSVATRQPLRIYVPQIRFETTYMPTTQRDS